VCKVRYSRSAWLMSLENQSGPSIPLRDYTREAPA
jgi:hypothetical protein